MTLSVDLIEPAMARAADVGFEHSFSGYLVHLLRQDLKAADAEKKVAAAVDELVAKATPSTRKRKPQGGGQSSKRPPQKTS